MNQVPIAPLIVSMLALMSASGLSGADATPSGPEVAVAIKYVTAVVSQDWKICSTMLAPKALERRQKEVLAFVKDSKTMTEESAKLEALGIATYGDLDKMTPQQFYVAERIALNQKTAPSQEVKVRQLQTLKVEVISVGSEDQGHFSHVLVRTHRDTLDMRVHELLLISLLQDSMDKEKWWVVPDTQLPVAEPLNAGQPDKSAPPSH
jgi:hypothetical protein